MFSEEVLFRGFILQRISDISKFWIGNTVNAVLFALVHIIGWVFQGKLIMSTAISTIISVFVFALVQGIVLRKTNSLWSCVLIHIFNNSISTMII